MNVPFAPPSPPALTRGQRQILELLVLGHTSKEMACLLGIGDKAAQQAVDRLRWRLGARNAAHAAVLGVALGLTDPARILAHWSAMAGAGLGVRGRGGRGRG